MPLYRAQSGADRVLAQQQAVDVEAFVDYRRSLRQRCRQPVGESQHLEIAGDDHVWRGTLPQLVADRGPGGTDRHESLEEPAVARLAELDGLEVGSGPGSRAAESCGAH